MRLKKTLSATVKSDSEETMALTFDTLKWHLEIEAFVCFSWMIADAVHPEKLQFSMV